MSVKQAELGRAWGLSRQRIGQMKKDGLPLTSLEEAEAWRSAHYPGSVATGQQGGSEKSTSINDGGAVLPSKPEPVKAADIRREDFVGTLARLKKDEVLAWGLLAEALRDWQQGSGPGAEVIFRQRLYKEMVGLRVMQEGKVDEILMRRGQLVTIGEAKKLFGQHLHGLRLTLKTLPSRLASRCNPSDAELAKATLTEAIERIFKTMNEWDS